MIYEHEFKWQKQSLTMQNKAPYNRPNIIRFFFGIRIGGSFLHRTIFFLMDLWKGFWILGMRAVIPFFLSRHLCFYWVPEEIVVPVHFRQISFVNDHLLHTSKFVLQGNLLPVSWQGIEVIYQPWYNHTIFYLPDLKVLFDNFLGVLQQSIELTFIAHKQHHNL